MRIREVMTARPRTVSIDDDLEFARQLMMWGGFRHLPVIADGALAGVITERDILQAKASAAAKNGRTPLIRDVMRVPAESVDPEDDVERVAVQMAGLRVGCMPVVKDGVLLGIVTRSDLLAFLGEPSRRTAAAMLPRDLPVSEVMTRDPPAAKPGDTLAEASARMSKLHVRHLPVLDEQRKVLGILSHRDVLRAAIPRKGRRLGPGSAGGAHVSDAMTSHAVTIAANASLTDALTVLVDRRFGALPVVDEAGRLVGILSYVDVLSAALAGSTIPASER